MRFSVEGARRVGGGQYWSEAGRGSGVNETLRWVVPGEDVYVRVRVYVRVYVVVYACTSLTASVVGGKRLSGTTVQHAWRR